MPDRLKRDSILTLTICSVGIEKIYKHDVQIVEQTFRFGSDGSIHPRIEWCVPVGYYTKLSQLMHEYMFVQ